MNLLIPLLVSLIVCLSFVGILLWVKTPIYRVERPAVKQLLEWVLLGQATENGWRVFCDYPIRHDALLEDIRLACERIDEEHYIGEQRPPFLFTATGLEEIKVQLERLSSEIERQNKQVK